MKFIIRTAGNFIFLTGLQILVFSHAPILYSELKFALNPPRNYPVATKEHQDGSIEVENKDDSNIVAFEPVNPNYSIIIGKIGVNAPVVEDVSMVNQAEYSEALRYGVAHARGTALPGEEGNSFLFAHSSLNFWQLGPYATVFNLLNKLEDGDLVTVYYDGKPYVYQVFENTVIPGWNTEPFYEEYDESVLTLITCDPPGSTVNRRVIKAKFVNVTNL